MSARKNSSRIAMATVIALVAGIASTNAAWAGKGGHNNGLTNEQLLQLFAAGQNNRDTTETPPSPFVPRRTGGGGGGGGQQGGG